MERIRVSISASIQQQVIGSTSEFNVGNRFTTEDIDVGYVGREQDAIRGTLDKMSCLRRTGQVSNGRILYLKQGDPRISSSFPCEGCGLRYICDIYKKSGKK